MDTPLIWAEVDLQAIAHNIRELKRVTSPSARLMAVVKANAYGHGIIEVADRAVRTGAEVLGVARIDEGIRLRKAGLDAPVLIFGYTPPNRAGELVAYDLVQTVSACHTAEALSRAATSMGKRIKIHIKIDTGMGRLGILPDCFRSLPSAVKTEHDAVRDVMFIARLKGLELEGLFTHMATSDSMDRSYAKRQFEIFMDLIDKLRLSGLEVPVKHAANSAAIINMPETHLDMVRAGISMYGLYPSDEVDKDRVALKPSMALKSVVVQLKNVPAGFRISYGITYETKHPTTIATVPVGYADGFNRLLSSCGQMLVCGRKAPVVGRVCMDFTMLDVGHIPDVSLEDEVVIFGRQGDLSITVDEIAEALRTINYEIVSTIMERVPRIYL